MWNHGTNTGGMSSKSRCRSSLLRGATPFGGSTYHHLVAEPKRYLLDKDDAARILPMTLENKHTNEGIRNEVLTPYQVAKILQIHTRTAIRRFEDGTIPAKKIGSRWRCSRKNLEAYLESSN
jgi:excisionase family DNA binding protein